MKIKSHEWLSKLISYDTTSRDSNLQLIGLVEDYLQSEGFDCRLTYDETQKKANLFASLAAGNNTQENGLILSGHTDVVPVDGQIWDTNPFVATEKNNRIYGRGTSDMKGFLAVILALVPEFVTLKLKRPLHFAFSYDEEVGCHGARVLIKDLAAANIKPAACIVGEPTSLKPVIAHKGIQMFRCTVHGIAAHSSLTPSGVNAIHYAAEIIHFINQYARTLREDGLQDAHFDVPFTSLTTNQITGGRASNIIPEACEFIYEFRHLPQVDAEVIQQKIKTYVQEKILPAIKSENVKADASLIPIGSVPSFESDNKAEIVALLQEMTGSSEANKVAYATEAGLFQQAGIPTIICGPGSIEQAHRPNEYIDVEQLTDCSQLLRTVVQRFCAA